MKKVINKGQSLFELVVAIAISALVIVAIVSLVSNSLKNATFSRNNAQAVALGQAATEWLRSQRDSDIVTFLTNVKASGQYCFVNLDWTRAIACNPATDFVTGTVFVRQGNFTVTVPGGKTLVKSDITVSWTDSGGTHTVENITYFTDWRDR